MAIAFPSLRGAFLDVRYRLDTDSALLKALLLIPLSTVLLEEVAFCGVLFGLWHVFPSLPAGGFPYLPANQFAAIATVAGVTALLGLLLCELRRRSDSLLAAAAGHWAANGLGVLLAALIWSWYP